MPQAVVFICALGCEHLALECKGSDMTLIACSPPEAQRLNCLRPLESGWVILSVPETIAFLYLLIARLLAIT